MNEYYLYATFSGKDFYPSKFHSEFCEFTVDSLHNTGDPKDSSKGSDLKYDFGYLGIVPKEKIESNFDEIFHRFLNNLIRLKQKLDLIQVEIVVSLTLAYETQCNFELSPDEIDLLKTLKATFTITCYQK